MWLITGPFDGEQGNVTKTKMKLLRSGRKYPLGRKDRELLVNHKKISREHCEFTVGPYMEEDMEDPTSAAKLEIFNSKEKSMSVDRAGVPLYVDTLSSFQLKSGDRVNIVAGITIEVEWRCVTCFLPPARNLPSISRDHCTSMGISLLMAPHHLATHHITSKYEFTPSLATSLLSAAQLVKVEWLQEYIRLGTTSDESNPFQLTALEQTFVPPQETKYRPTFAPTLPPPLRSFKFWEPSEERLNFLNDYRFVLLANKDGELDSDTRGLVLRGGAEYDGFCMASGHSKWRQMLAKAKRKKEEAGIKVVIISNQRVIPIVGADKWQEMVADAETVSVPVIDVETLLNAIVGIDISIIHRSPSLARDSSPLPDFIPNTHPDEPSFPGNPVPFKGMKDVDNGTVPLPSNGSKDVVSKPPSPPSEEPAPPPRKKLIRRLKPLSVTDDQGQSEPTAPSRPLSDNLASAVPLAPPTTRPKLKRRAATPAAPSVVDSVLAKNEATQEPPHKRFKALFEASDPDKMAVDAPDSAVAACDTVGTSAGTAEDTASATQTGSQTRDATLGRLDAVAEEEESTLPNQFGAGRTAQRTTVIASRQPPHPNVADSSEDQVGGGEGQGVPKINKGSEPKQLDTDQAFLTAVASRKRGKKGEDDFDREFNKLRISKPDIRREEEEDWAVLGDFDDDVRNIRGNFMVVVDIGVYRHSQSRGTAKLSGNYDGKPNFKKFKKISTPSARVPVELVIKTEDDYGVGSGYWKDNTTSKDYSKLVSSNPEAQRRRARTVLESDEDDVDDVPVTKRTKKQAPQRESKGKTAPLFFDSDEESTNKRGSQQQRTVRQAMLANDDTTGASTRNSKKRHIIADDDSDEDAAFKGFGKKRKLR